MSKLSLSGLVAALLLTAGCSPLIGVYLLQTPRPNPPDSLGPLTLGIPAGPESPPDPPMPLGSPSPSATPALGDSVP